jgi:hypothetical protein
MVRRVAAPLLAVATLALAVPGATAQLSVGVHLARASDVFHGANGGGASVEFDAPLLPLGVMVAGDYFRPDCGPVSGCSFMGASADAHFRLPFPLLQPYALAGGVIRRVKTGDGVDAESNSGIAVGVGVDLRVLVLGAYGEARYEFVQPDHELLFRLGIRF